jgi:entericidin B
MSTRVVKVAFGLALTLGVVSLTACNTIAGAGKDVSSAGHATTNAANAAK